MFTILPFGGALVARLFNRWEAWVGFAVAALLGFIWGWASYGFDAAAFGLAVGSLAGFAGPELARGALGWFERHTMPVVGVGTIVALYFFAPMVLSQLLTLGLVLGVIYLGFRTMFRGIRGGRR